jgi:hypothetical protein
MPWEQVCGRTWGSDRGRGRQTCKQYIHSKLLVNMPMPWEQARVVLMCMCTVGCVADNTEAADVGKLLDAVGAAG